MTWVKLDDQFFSHPKAVRAGRNARILYVAALCWCKNHLTDGLIPKSALPMLAAQADVPGRTSAAALVDVGLWHDEGDHWRVNDFHDYNLTADEIEERREEIRKARSAAGRKGGFKSGQTRRSNEAKPKQTGSKNEAETREAKTKPETETKRDIEIPQQQHSLLGRRAPGGGGEVISITDALRGGAA